MDQYSEARIGALGFQVPYQVKFKLMEAGRRAQYILAQASVMHCLGSDPFRTHRKLSNPAPQMGPRKSHRHLGA